MIGDEGAVLRFLGGALRGIAVLMIAYGGLCACAILTSRGDEFSPGPDAWPQVAIALPVGVACFLAGSWLVRRASPKGPDQDEAR